VPALFISGAAGGRTPVGNAEEALGWFPNAQHLIIDGAGHGDELFAHTPEILARVTSFMAGL